MVTKPSFCFIDISTLSSATERMVRLFYDKFMVRMFPLEDERDPVEVWVAAMASCTNASKYSKDPRLHVLLAVVFDEGACASGSSPSSSIPADASETASLESSFFTTTTDAAVSATAVVPEMDLGIPLAEKKKVVKSIEPFVSSSDDVHVVTIEGETYPVLLNPRSAELLSYCTIAGAAVYEYYPRCSSCLLSYFCVDDAFRSFGLGRRLVYMSYAIIRDIAKSWRESAAPRMGYFFGQEPLYFAETNAIGVEDGVMDPVIRHSVLKRIGFVALDFFYIQPPVSIAHKPCWDLLLLILDRSVPCDGLLASRVLQFMKDYCDCYGREYEDLDWWKVVESSLLGKDLVTLHTLPWNGRTPKHLSREQNIPPTLEEMKDLHSNTSQDSSDFRVESLIGGTSKMILRAKL